MSFYGDGFAGEFIHSHDHRVQLSAMPRRFHPHRHLRQKLLDDDVFVDADDAIVRTRHAAIRLIGGAAGQDARIGGRDMGVSADHGRNASIEMPAHGDFFARQLGVKIDETYLDFGTQLGKESVGFAKRAIDGCHVGAPLQIDNRAVDSVSRLDDNDAGTRQLRRVIGWTQQARLAREVVINFALVPDMIAAGEHVDAEAEQIVGQLRRDAEAAGGVFAIGDREMNVFGFYDRLQMTGDNRPSG